MGSQTKTEQEIITCSRCHKQVVWNFATSRRNVGYPENGKICDHCENMEAFVDMSNCLFDEAIHWEYSFHQLCCGNKDQDGHEEFEKFLAFRKHIGKNDPPYWEIKKKILLKMFPSFVLSPEMKQKYVEAEASWEEKFFSKKK